MTTAKSITSVQELVPLLYVEGMAASLEFYTKQLGFKQTMSWAPRGDLLWCRVERDRAAVMLQQAE